jgi:hypothetical protein
VSSLVDQRPSPIHVCQCSGGDEEAQAMRIDGIVGRYVTPRSRLRR